MKHPPYPLRQNKAIDRLSFIDAIRRLDRLTRLSEYTYYALGGPYLDDFHLVNEMCPEIKLVCIEENPETYKRQDFHIPCRRSLIQLENIRMKAFITRYDAKDKKSIFWLDYTELSYGNFKEFIALLPKVAEHSMIKITLRADPREFMDKRGEQAGSGAQTFKSRFGALMPDKTVDPPRDLEGFASLLQDMVQLAAQQALPGAIPVMFQPVSSFYYNDGTGMLTVTGVVCRREEEPRVKDAFQDLHFRNLTWEKPKYINVPFLTTKERLHLQEHLPCSVRAGQTLHNALGYRIDKDDDETRNMLQQYADFYRYYPYFMKAVP